jgi:hypothetical protein
MTLAVLALTACGTSGWLTESSTERAADQHAAVAGTVMTRDNWERTANDAAYLVVGRGADDTIDALDVEGTTYHGKAVLRITVERSGEFGDGSTIQCYAYTFRHSLGDEAPEKVPCAGTVVALTPPVEEPAFDQAAAAELAGILRRLASAHTLDAGTIEQQVSAAFGPPVAVGAGPAGLDHGTNNGTTFVRLSVPSHGECMWALVTTAGQVSTGIGNRRECAD